MQLSLHADYALRVLIYLGTHPDQTVPTGEISAAYGISKHHLVRVVHTLCQHGYVRVLPGRTGGVMLARQPREIRLGDVVRDAEPHLHLVECFDRETNTCPIVSSCGLRSYLRDALRAFLESLNRHTLADLMAAGRGNRLARVFVQLV
jgi:Rrf2 family transcriptional regulator, nitric oxide-sensitive transcriptional repressor